MLLTSLRATGLLLVLCCMIYPALVTGLGQALFPDEANGSLVSGEDGQILGSSLVGQAFSSPAYLQGRPSAAGRGYDGAASGGSNLGTGSRALADRRAADRARLEAENPQAPGPVPEVLLAASGSGLDPDLPLDAARWQVPRVAAARGVAPERVSALIDELARGRDLGFLGEPTLRVLSFNLALDRRFPVSR